MRLQIIAISFSILFAGAAWPCLYNLPSLLPHGQVVPQDQSTGVPLNARIVGLSGLVELPRELNVTLVSDGDEQEVDVRLNEQLLSITPINLLAPQTQYTLTIAYPGFSPLLTTTFTTGDAAESAPPDSLTLIRGEVQHSPSEFYWHPCEDRLILSTERWHVEASIEEEQPWPLEQAPDSEEEQAPDEPQDGNHIAGYRILRTDIRGQESLVATQVGDARPLSTLSFVEPPLGDFRIETFDLAGNTRTTEAFSITDEDVPGCASMKVQKSAPPFALLTLVLVLPLLRTRRVPRAHSTSAGHRQIN